MRAKVNRLSSILLVVAAALQLTTARAEDINIFMDGVAGGAPPANIMILIDNSSNWARQAQAWGEDPATGAKLNQGQAELNAVTRLIDHIGASSAQAPRIGLALLTPYNSNSAGTGGGYIRFGARDMAVAENRTALKNILANIYRYTNGGGALNEVCCGMAHKDETAALYELWKYYSGLRPYSGGLNATNTRVDVRNNLAGGPTGANGLTAYAQGLTSDYAIDSDGRYVSPINSDVPCGNSYIIYIANNSNGTTGSTENVYQPSIVPALAPLAPTVGNTWTDEWTRFLYRSGARVTDSDNNGEIATYILDAYNAQNNAGYSASLRAAASQGGGQYYQVGTGDDVYLALLNILVEIQSVNSTFASASLPISTTNRAQNLNQVFIPMFRPDARAQARWFGNLKQYQLVVSNGGIELGDKQGRLAVNPLTGFLTPCAESFWTTDSTDEARFPGGYWNYTPQTKYAEGTCASSSFGAYTDMPDGPHVEKGGVAEVIRKGNNPPTTNTTPTWSPLLRTVLTTSSLSSTALVPFNASNTGLPDNLVNWVLGYDVQNENNNLSTTESRPSMHGDAIHSQPLPVDYGSGNIQVYYGANDGTLRSVNSATGKEDWAFVAREFYTPTPTAFPGGVPTGFQRLMWSDKFTLFGDRISPLIAYPGMPDGLEPMPRRKDYYFDGSIGVYQNADNSAIWIYPTMRRGGRMIYAFDVTNRTSPSIMWKVGCPNKDNDIGCTPGFSGSAASIGQTWSKPVVAARILGYNHPVVIVGGGYDNCEDAQLPTCTSPTGAIIYLLHARTGELLNSFRVVGMKSVAADIALLSATTAGVVDHAYAVDTGGNIFRIDFNADPSAASINRVAYTNGGRRKFLYPPALVQAPGNQVYLAIGSGDREHPLQSDYNYANTVNRFYVFKDNLQSTSAVNLDDTTRMVDVTSGSACDTAGITPSSTLRGWFMNLNQYGQGEQTVTSAIIVAGMVAFSTNRPEPGSSTACSSTLGQANGYWVNLFNGSGAIGVEGAACGGARAVPFVGGGLPPSPVIATVRVGNRASEVIVIGAAQRGGSASSVIAPQVVRPAIIPRRNTIYWKSSGEN